MTYWWAGGTAGYNRTLLAGKAPWHGRL